MNFVKLNLTENGWSYLYQDASNIEMGILGIFLTDDVGSSGRGVSIYKEWTLDDSQSWAVSGNFSVLDKEGDYMFLADQCSQEEDPTELKISRQQFVKLLDDWQEKVCKTKPSNVIIKHENDEYSIETSD